LSRRSGVRKERSVAPALMDARLLAFAAVFSLLLLSVGVVAAERETPPSPPAVHGGEGTRFAEPGMIAPDFTVLDVEGRPFNLWEEVSRKPVLLLFWSVFCDPCRSEMTILQNAHDKYAEGT